MNRKRTNLPMTHIDVPIIDNPNDIKKYKKSDKMKYAYEKHINPSIKRDNKRKRSIKMDWIKNHWINLLALIISAISLIVSLYD